MFNGVFKIAYERLRTSDLQFTFMYLLRAAKTNIIRSDHNIFLTILPTLLQKILLVLWIRLRLSRVENLGPVVQSLSPFKCSG